MAEFDSKGRQLFTVVRTIEYHGHEEWLRATLESSRIPILGKYTQALRDGKPFPEGCYIRSGQTIWEDTSVEGEEIAKTPIPIPPGSTSIQ